MPYYYSSEVFKLLTQDGFSLPTLFMSHFYRWRVQALKPVRWLWHGGAIGIHT